MPQDAEEEDEELLRRMFEYVFVLLNNVNIMWVLFYNSNVSKYYYENVPEFSTMNFVLQIVRRDVPSSAATQNKFVCTSNEVEILFIFLSLTVWIVVFYMFISYRKKII